MTLNTSVWTGRSDTEGPHMPALEIADVETQKERKWKGLKGAVSERGRQRRRTEAVKRRDRERERTGENRK